MLRLVQWQNLTNVLKVAFPVLVDPEGEDVMIIKIIRNSQIYLSVRSDIQAGLIFYSTAMKTTSVPFFNSF